MHAVAIRLQDGGFGDSVIAVALGTDPEQVPPLLRIAANKLARLLAEDDKDTIDLATSPRRSTTTQPTRGASCGRTDQRVDQ